MTDPDDASLESNVEHSTADDPFALSCDKSMDEATCGYEFEEEPIEDINQLEPSTSLENETNVNSDTKTNDKIDDSIDELKVEAPTPSVVAQSKPVSALLSSVYDYTESDNESIDTLTSGKCYKKFGSTRKRLLSYTSELAHENEKLAEQQRDKEPKEESVLEETDVITATDDTDATITKKKPGPKPRGRGRGKKRGAKRAETENASEVTTEQTIESTDKIPEKPKKSKSGRKKKVVSDSEESKPPKPVKPPKPPIPYIELPPTGLPEGWAKKALERKFGATAGKKDIYIFSPEGKRFRSKKDIRLYCEKFDIDPAFIETSLHGRLPSDSPKTSRNNSPLPGRDRYRSDDGSDSSTFPFKRKYKKRKSKTEESTIELPKRLRRTSTKRKLSSAVLEALQDSDYDNLSDSEFLRKIESCEPGSVATTTRKKVKHEPEAGPSYPRLNKLKYTKQPRPYSKNFGLIKGNSDYARYCPKNTARKSTGGPPTYKVEPPKEESKSMEAETDDGNLSDNREAIPKVIIKRLTDKRSSKDEKKNHVLIIKSTSQSPSYNDKDPYSFEEVEADDSKTDMKSESLQPDLVFYAEPSNYQESDITETDTKLDDILNKPLKMGSQEFVDWLFSMNLLSSTQYCTKHKDYYTGGFNILKLQSYPDNEELASSGYYTWNSICCATKISIFHGSFFGSSKNPKLVLALMNKWASMSKKRYKVKSLEFVSKMNNYFRSICTVMVQEIARNFGINRTVVEISAVIFEKTINSCNVQVEVLGIYDRESGHYRFFAYQYTTEYERNDVFARVNQQHLINRKNAIVICDSSIDVEYFRKFYKKVLICYAGETGENSNETIHKYLRNHVSKLMMEVIDLLLTIEEIQLLLNELSWREIYGRTRVDAYKNLFRHMQELTEQEDGGYEVTHVLDCVVRNPDGCWALEAIPKPLHLAEQPEVYNTEIKINTDIIKKGFSLKELKIPGINSEVLKKFRALAKASCNLIAEQGFLKLQLPDTNVICLECGTRMGAQKHYSSYYSCSLCTFTSSCSNRLSYHFFSHDKNCIENGSPVLFVRRKNPYIPLLECYFCKCGFIPETGNEMANHLIKCKESDKIAYPSMEAALGYDSSDYESSSDETDSKLTSQDCTNIDLPLQKQDNKQPEGISSGFSKSDNNIIDTNEACIADALPEEIIRIIPPVPDKVINASTVEEEAQVEVSHTDAQPEPYDENSLLILNEECNEMTVHTTLPESNMKEDESIMTNIIPVSDTLDNVEYDSPAQNKLASENSTDEEKQSYDEANIVGPVGTADISTDETLEEECSETRKEQHSSGLSEVISRIYQPISYSDDSDTNDSIYEQPGMEIAPHLLNLLTVHYEDIPTS